MPEITKALTDAISEALTLGKSELNEACTCDWIVKPLLQASGYKLYEIQPQQTDSAGKVPDYTILPGTEHTWFVEAKAWGVTLNDQHAQQAMIYAFTSNRRWVALTNGREWRLYDNTINGPLHGKLVADMHLGDLDRAAAFLRAIGRESMLNGGAEQFASKAQLAVILEHDLSDASSDIIKAIWTRLKARHGLSSVTKEQVVGYFQRESIVPARIPAILKPVVGPPTPPMPKGKRTVGMISELLAEQDTIVVPAQREGFLRAFLGENAWWAIRIKKERIPHIKYIAAYQVKPISAITHIAGVAKIEPYDNSDKYKVFFTEPAHEIGPLKPGPEMKTGFLQSPRLTTYAKLTQATSLDEVF
ncbi:MAG: hypothetical protein WCL39_00255 [Armatimonadota bacterium]